MALKIIGPPVIANNFFQALLLRGPMTSEWRVLLHCWQHAAIAPEAGGRRHPPKVNVLYACEGRLVVVVVGLIWMSWILRFWRSVCKKEEVEVVVVLMAVV